MKEKERKRKREDNLRIKSPPGKEKRKRQVVHFPS